MENTAVTRLQYRERSEVLGDDFEAILRYFEPKLNHERVTRDEIASIGIQASSLVVRRRVRMLHEAARISSLGKQEFEYSGAGHGSSLAATIEKYVQPPADLSHIYRCFENLLRILRYAGKDSAHKSLDLLQSLDTAQRHIVTLLEEWWTGNLDSPTSLMVKTYLFGYALAYEDDETYIKAVRNIEELAPSEDLELFATVRKQFDKGIGPVYEVIMADDKNLAPEQQYMTLIEQQSLYDEKMFMLFLAELNPKKITLDQSDYRQVIRNIASTRATTTRIGHACLKHIERILKGDAQIEQTERLVIRDIGCIIPTAVEPCPWLQSHMSNKGLRSSLPFYLWDIENNCTAPVSDITEPEIEYAIISHTWGRWREEGPGAQVPGVPWLIPRNTRFDVEKLPVMLASAGFREPYVWMDLLCIPQDESVEWQVKICKMELPRQATIFQNAATAAAWLHDVCDWSGMRWAILWCCLRILKYKSYIPVEDDDIYQRAIALVEKYSSKPIELLKRGTSESGTPTETPSDWFSSLWTLQESMIRPDMLLLDINFQPIFSQNAMAITLESLVTLSNEIMVDQINNDNPSSRNVFPRGVQEIRNCLGRSAIVNLNDTSRFSSLIMGRTRTCSHSRAAAIMSVTGATDWFIGRTLEQFRGSADTECMIFGLYPWEFVNEVYRKSGPSFFSCYIMKATLRTTRDEHHGTEVTHTLQGTMLPFTANGDGVTVSSIIPDQGFCNLESHISTESWVINVDGSVSLPAVGIITSNSDVDECMRDSLECRIVGNDPWNHQNEDFVMKTSTDLFSWVHGFHGEAYAICTMHSTTFMKGIILHRLDTQTPFVKAAVFSTVIGRKFRIPGSTGVQWIVQ